MRKFSKIICACLLIVLGALIIKLPAAADAKATVVADSAYIRAEAGTNGKPLAGAMKGDVLDIISSTTDSDGYTWYKVWIDDSTSGYIRSDMVTKEGDVTAEKKPETKPEAKEETPKPDNTPKEDIPAEVSVTTKETEPVDGTVTDDVRVRKGPSTGTDVVANAKQSTLVTVKGFDQSADETWYLVSYKVDSVEVNGYIRSDLVKLSGDLVEKKEEPEPEPEPETKPEPEPEPEPKVYYDYEVVYEDDEAGNRVWYLNDYIGDSRYDIKEFIALNDKLSETKKDAEKTIRNRTLWIFILLIIIAILIGAGVYAYIRFRQWYFGYDEGEDEPEARHEDTVKRQNRDNGYAKTSAQPSSTYKMQTVGTQSGTRPLETQVKKPESQVATKLPEGALRLPDGRIQMPDGTIRKAVVGVKLPDGSIKLSDGRIRRPDGTMIPAPKPEVTAPSTPRVGNSTREVRPVSMNSAAIDDDDMEFGFLNMDSNMSDE